MFYRLFSILEFYEIDNPIDLLRNKHKEQGKFEDNLTIVLIYLSLTAEASNVNILLSQCQPKPAPNHNCVKENYYHLRNRKLKLSSLKVFNKRQFFAA